MRTVELDHVCVMDHVALLLLCVAPVARCYSSGQVVDSCEDMRPHHSGLSPQTVPAPFSVTAEHSSYKPGEQVTVQLQALGSTPFTGFLLQAREVGGQSPVGSFTLTSGATQLLTCSQRPNSAVSHRSGSVKTSIQVTWSPESTTDRKPVHFHASFAQNFRTFWVSVTSPTVTFINNSTGGSETPPPSPTTTSPLPNTTILQPAEPAEKISRADCGVTKVCFSQPSDCDPAVSADCYFMSAMMLSPSDAAVRYELTGPSDGYVSFGFSDDQMMGNDDIYVCGVGSDGLVRLQRVFSTGRTTPQAVPLGNVSELTVSAEDRVISCCFTSMNSISTQRSTGLKNSYYLLFAHGPSSRGQIQFHTATFISTDKVHISRPQTIREAGQPPIIRAHGALMLTAWMTAGSLGMMVARYLRGMAKGQTLWGKDVWFLVHVVVMSVTTAATVIAFILPFSHVQTWSEGAHPVLGCLVMSFSFFQPILALLRCGPQHPLRYLFYWSHVLNALVIKALAGLKLIDSSPDQWLMKVMGGFVSWEVLFFILMEVHVKWKVNRADSLESNMITADLLLVALFLLGNISFLVALLVGIGTS
ncbi:putative ferric-chelate reductase 1 isoform X2 [Seriola aureovittata]|uniref:putative ferric-chelate reductase 1 isoform X2 n=1 Tax=Seriola aureovittata TaxID=2871759 RepID=UPI0024BD607A|nr:putative ferric-chelate reductase 1 isoform X2 [Seriola aureovittata]